MSKLLLIGPITKDIIISGSKVHRSIGGAPYFQAAVLTGLGVDVTAVITVSQADGYLLGSFFPEVVLHPVYVERTMEFENSYPENNPNKRNQRAIIPHNPILPEHLSSLDIASYDAILLLPLCPFDIPLETIRYLSKFGRPLCLGVQGYLRHLYQNEVILRPWDDLYQFIPYITMMFADEAELRIMTAREDWAVTRVATSLLSDGLSEIVVTGGDKGSLACSATGEMVCIPAFPPDSMIDATGLGDTYMAVYISERVQKQTPRDSGLFAAAASTLKLERQGALTTTRQEIESKLSCFEEEEIIALSRML